MVERIQNRLAKWKTHLLSFARRLVLTQATLSTIPNYSMQCPALPSKITQSVDKLCRNFIWGTTDSKRKLHLVSWKKITKPKKEGRLGLQPAKERNLALLAKLNWFFHQEKDSLWTRVLSHKYLRRRRQPRSKPGSCSSTWAALKKGEPISKKDIKWIVGKESKLSFWHNKWLSDELIRSLIAGPFQRNEDSILLRNVTQHNFWNLGGLSFVFPTSLS